MDSTIDSLFDQYERGGMTRRHLVQALAALVLPAKILAQGPGSHSDCSRVGRQSRRAHG